MRVFITTSGLGTRLENLTQYTNKALVPIGDRYAICRIIERFPAETTQFVVTLGYYGKHVRDFLELAYPDRQFTFVEVTPYEGAGSSQAHSMLSAMRHLQEPFLYHCCDTLLPVSYTPPSLEDDSSAPVTMFVAPHADYISYTGILVSEDGERVQRIQQKREGPHDFAYIGVAWVANPIQFWAALEAAVCHSRQSAHLGDVDAYRWLMDAGTRIHFRVVPAFFDTGNVDSYRHACQAFPGKHIVLAKPNESLCFLPEQGRVVKFLHSLVTNKRRVARGNAFDALGIGPKIVGSRPNFMVMAYEEGDVLAECKEWGEVGRLLEWTRSNLWLPEGFREESRFADVCHRFYYGKTMGRLTEYRSKKGDMVDYPVVNGCRVGTLAEVLPRVPWDALNTTRFTRFHGDFILDNVLRRPDGSFCLLDWRDSFDTETEWGDPAYDVAKLRHNMVFHHSNIERGAYSVERQGSDAVFVNVDCSYLLMQQMDILDKWIVEKSPEFGWSLQKIRILQAIIWLNMAPLYDAPLCDFLYYFGKWNLWLATTTATTDL